MKKLKNAKKRLTKILEKSAIFVQFFRNSLTDNKLQKGPKKKKFFRKKIKKKHSKIDYSNFYKEFTYFRNKKFHLVVYQRKPLMTARRQKAIF